MEEVKTEVKPEETQVKTEIKPEESLITKVSKVEVKPTEVEEKPEFDIKGVENIKDPEAKAWAQGAFKSFEKGYQVKFQDLARQRESLEKEHPSSWTPERLQSEMNKPDFVQAANSVLNTQPKDDDSVLSDKESTRIKTLETELASIKQQSTLSHKLVQDEQLKGKYANYNPNAVDILTADLISNKVQATREHLHKVLDYDNAIKRAYELGKSDKNVDNVEAINSMSIGGGTVVGDDTVPKAEEGESSKNYFLRLATRRLKQKTESGQIRK